MGVPDLSPYIDLTFYDKDPQDIIDSALADLAIKLPDWKPREGNVEVLLLESMALQVAEAIFAANRLPGAVVMAILRLYGIEPDAGLQPTVQLTFNVSDTIGHDIPADTGVRMDLAGGLEPVVFTTVTALAIPPGSSTGTVLASGDRYTAEANGVAAGTLVQLIDSIPFVDSVVTGTTVADGIDPETDEEWIERGVQRFARLSETLVLPRHFEAAALENPAVVRAKALDNFNSALGTGVPGDHPGHISVAVYGDATLVSAGVKTDLDVAMEAAAAANLSIHIMDPTISTQNVTVQVARKVGYDDATVKANVDAAVRAFLTPAEWDWDTVLRRNQLMSVISNAEGVDYVDSLTVPAADVTLSGVAALVNAGTVTVTTI